MTVTTSRATMQVRKRNGDTEAVDVNKIVRAVERWAGDLDDVDPMRVATKTISGLYDGATTAELDRLSIRTAAEMIGEEPQYSRLAARLLAGYIDKEVRNQGVASFSQAIGLGRGDGARRARRVVAEPSAVPRGLGPPHPAGAVRWQVFGLMGAPSDGSPSTPTDRRFPGPNLRTQCFVDGCRSHSPLRGSPGITPGSLLPHSPGLGSEPAACATICGGQTSSWDHMLCRRVGVQMPVGRAT